MKARLPDRSAAAGIILGLIAATTIAGAVLLAAQERGRIRLSAEFRAFQLGTDALRAVDAGDSAQLDQIEGLAGLGVYDNGGKAIYRYGNAPESVVPQTALRKARYENGIISFLRPVGWGMRRQGGAAGLPASVFAGPVPGTEPPPPPPEGGDAQNDKQRKNDAQNSPRKGMMGLGMGNGPGMMGGGQRLLFVAYDTASLKLDEWWIYLAAAVVVAAVGAASGLLVSLARSLGAYKAKEERDRGLLSLGEAARTLAHEIKNPLGVVKIQCALLRRGVPEEALEGVRVIEEETDRLADLASRMKAFLSADPGKPVFLEPGEILESYARRWGGDLSVQDRTPPAAAVFCDRLRLEQILDNLIANARESGAAAEAGPPELSCRLERGRVLFRVADRGRGIPAENADRVFDLLFTTKTSGAGLGLSLAKRWAEASGGRLSHQVREGGGTVFTLDLPAHRDAKRRGGAA